MENRGESLLQNQKSTAEYFAKLPSEDRETIKTLASKYKETLQKRGATGSLVAVGGSLDRPFPRKDIDLLMLVKQVQDFPQSGTEIEIALRDFNENFRPIVETVAGQQDGFVIVEVIEPAVDEEYQNSNLLKHDGAISVRKVNGTPIDFIRNSATNDLAEFAKDSKRPWVLLSAA